MDKYEVMLYPQAYRDIDEIYAYIALEKQAPEFYDLTDHDVRCIYAYPEKKEKQSLTNLSLQRESHSLVI